MNSVKSEWVKDVNQKSDLQVIDNCFDSHCHFMATGQVALGLKLQFLKAAKNETDLIRLLSEIQIIPEYFRSNWLTGFGWDHQVWPDQKLPSKFILDQIFPDIPVFFSRIDGHASWLNSKAISILSGMGFDFNQDDKNIIRLQDGTPSGILLEAAHIQALQKLPDFNETQVKSFLIEAQKIFNSAGFTHVRDLSMTLQNWKCLSDLYNENKLTLCIESFITAENILDLPRVLNDIQWIHKNPCPQLKINGVKFFLDGSLGSETAYISENYLKNKTSKGQFHWKQNDIIDLLKQCWSQSLEVAVHCIGDQAVHEIVMAAREVSANGILGRLHLEHVQLVRPETIQLMKPLHITCHMQPCHWLSDHEWLPRVLNEKSMKYLFPWELIRKNKIPIFFGSDSPIEPTSLFNNFKAIVQSPNSKFIIPKLMMDWKMFHSYTARSENSVWSQCRTEFKDEKIVQVYFNNKPLL